MNDQEPRGQASGQPTKSWTQATQTQQEVLGEELGSPSCGVEQTVAWKEDFSSWFRKLFCPNCHEDGRMNLVLDIRDVGGFNMPFYTCKMCHCQFTRKPRYENIIDKEDRL